MDSLEKRYINCPHGYNAYGGCYSAWDSWARWVVLGVIIVGALILFFLFSCISARRRRKMGYAPYRGTGWAVGGQPPPGNYNQRPYYASNNYSQPPPAYGANQGYYAPQRENDVEMQPPQNSYQPNSGYTNVYSPPPGPPPTKGDGIVR